MTYYIQGNSQSNGPPIPFPGNGDFPGNEENNPFEPATSISSPEMIIAGLTIGVVIAIYYFFVIKEKK